MKGKSRTHYYQSSGFSPYYFANVLYNIVKDPEPYLRNLEEMLGDSRTDALCGPFPRYSNLHLFIEDIIESIFFEDEGENHPVLFDFLVYAGIAENVRDRHDLDELAELRNSDDRYAQALQGLVEEVFHILFVNIIFLQRFNALVAGHVAYLGDAYRGEGSDVFTRHGRLRRIAVPAFVRDAVYHRDQGECRSCKKAIDRMLRPEDKERYDHIVPLATGGANDVTNLQLLCEACNVSKSDRAVAASPIYRRMYPLK